MDATQCSLRMWRADVKVEVASQDHDSVSSALQSLFEPTYIVASLNTSR